MTQQAVHSSGAIRRLAAAAVVGVVASGLTVLASSVVSAAPTFLSNPILEDVAPVPATVATSIAPAPCSIGVACGTPTTMQYGGGVQKRLAGYTAGGVNYTVLNVAEGEAYVELLRVDNPAVTGSRDVIFAAKADGAPYNQVIPNSPESRTMADVLASDVIGEGSDNTFANAGGTNYNNIERISFMRRTPIVPSDATRVGLTIMERGGNDPFKVAAVTAVDGDGTPTAWGPVLAVPASAWGSGTDGQILRTESTVLRKDVADATYRPSTTTAAQKLAGMYISMADLSIATGTPVYGVSMIPQDQTAVGGPFANLATTEGQAGIDLIGGIFVSGVPLSANPVTQTGSHGAPQQLPLDYVPNDLSQINTELARLVPPGAGTVNDDGTVVTVPGEGHYTLDRVTLVVTFEPDPDFTGEATPVGYEITDVNGLTATSTITPTVVPIAFPDISTGPQGVPQRKDVRANDNPDGSVTLVPASLTLLTEDGTATDTVTVPGQGTFSVDRTDPTNPVLVFTPLPDFTGVADPVGYAVRDAEGNLLSSTYTPTVTPVAPSADPDTTRGPQGAAQSVDPLANDAAGNAAVPLDPATLTLLNRNGDPVTSVAVPGQGSYTIDRTDATTPRLVFTPLPTFIGTADPVAYRIADANGTPADSTYIPTVTPVAVPDTTTGPQGVPQTADALANDDRDGVVDLDPSTLTLLDGDGAAVDAVTVPGEGRYTVVDGALVFTPEPDFTGTATPVDYAVRDADGNVIASTYTPTVTPVEPTAVPDTSRGPQGVPQTVDPLANDRAGDPNVPLDAASLTLLTVDGDPVDRVRIPGEGTYTVAGGRLVFTPESDFTGVATAVGYRISDTNGTPVSSRYTPTVAPVTPTAVPDTSTGRQGMPQIIDPLADDIAGDPGVPLDPTTLTLLDADGAPVATLIVPGQGTYRVVDGTIVFTPLPEFTGTADPVRYRISDANGTSAESTVTPTVTPVTPTAVSDTSTGRQGVPQIIDPLVDDTPGDPGVPLDPTTLTLLDADGAPIATLIVPGQGTYRVVDGAIVFTPLPEFTGTADPVRYRISDANGTPAESTVTPTVTAVTAPDTSTAPSPSPQSVDPLVNDPAAPGITLDPGTLTLVDANGTATDRVTYPEQGTYVLQGTTITFTPVSGFLGVADPVVYRVTDSEGFVVGATYTATAAAPALANTGLTDMVPVGATGAGLLVAGAVLLLLGRRRRV